MIARIIADGTLAIEAESELETYALARWKEDFDQNRVALKIVCEHCLPPRKSQYIEALGEIRKRMDQTRVLTEAEANEALAAIR